MIGQDLVGRSIMNLPGDLSREVVNELCRGWHAQEVLAEQEQRQIAAQQGEHHTVNGLGQKVLSVTPIAFHYWGQRLGYQCWRDKGFRAEFLRDNPHARVRYTPRTASLRVQGRKK
jgi:hypothetical protein